MGKIVSIHSYRGGTGKSNTTANVSTLLALRGMRVGIVDTDIQSPGVHVLFQFDLSNVQNTLNNYLWGQCDIEACAYDVSDCLPTGTAGKLFLVPSSIKLGEIARVLKEGYDVGLLNDGFEELLSQLKLDVLMIDTHPGLNEETLVSMAISDGLIIILRPDQQDYQGTGITVDVARQLEIENLGLLLNKVPAVYNADEVRSNVAETYDADVLAVVQHSDELMAFGSSNLFVLERPDSPTVSQEWGRVADWIETL